MAKNNQGIEVNVADVITIKGAKGTQCNVKGQVITVDWYPESGWYIELVSDNGYGYWKQRSDGGEIVEVNGEAV